MSPELDLRGLDQAHDPSPEFVDRLRRRLDAAVHAATDRPLMQVDDLALPASVEVARPRRRRAVLVAAAIVAVVAVGAALLVQSGDSGPTVHVGEPETPTTVGPAVNGWIAVGGDGDIFLVRPGDEARELDVAGSATADDACPTWSPDGTTLAFGRVTGASESALGDAALVVVPLGRDGSAGAPTVIALDDFRPLEGFDPHPCAVWAPGGRLVALAGGGDVWLVDTQTEAITRLPDLRPSDLEWRPHTDELAIAGDMGPNRSAETRSSPVSIYSVSTGELRPLGAVEAAHLTWSPDGSTLAYAAGEDGSDELWLVDANGDNPRRLVAHLGEAVHGIGPVWSPSGERIAYQRRVPGSAERHEVVLVRVDDGTETVVQPPQTPARAGAVAWYPWIVTWSPDGSTLLYAAWSIPVEGSPVGEQAGIVAVPVDVPTQARVLAEGIVPADSYSHRWAPLQMWGRQPG